MTQSTSSESLEGRPLNRNLFLNINEKRISLKDQGSNKINRCKKNWHRFKVFVVISASNIPEPRAGGPRAGGVGHAARLVSRRAAPRCRHAAPRAGSASYFDK